MAAMPRHKDGEVMDLTWEAYVPDSLYVRGHMDPSDAHDRLLDYYGVDDHQWKTPVASYGRFSMGHGPDGGQGLVECDGPGRGIFKIMVADVKYRAIDRQAWNQRKGFQVRRLGYTPPAMECACSDPYVDACGCNGACACHWYPLDAAIVDGRIDPR